MIEEKVKKNNKLIIVGVLCLIAIISIVGFTYSFFAVNVENNTSITGTAASLSISVTATKMSPASSVKGGLIPQLDAYITSAVIGVNGSCVDGNNNPVCQVYKITVKNNGGSTIKVNGIVELDNKDNPHLKWARISGTSSPTLVGTIKTPQEKELVSEETFTGTQQKDYYIVTWISETGLGQTDTGVFNGVVTFSDTNKSNNSSSNPALTTLTNLGLEDDLNEEVLTTFTSAATTDEGIYASEDDLGTTYYFRGAVENNYVKFGKNSSNNDMYWRIIRINGDGTVRMIYDGTSAHENGESSTDRQVGTSAFNSSYNSNGYVSYMYGSTLGSTYALEHSNDINSTIKTYLEGDGTESNLGWYGNNLLAYEEYIADAIYCNDREVVTDPNNYNNLLGDSTIGTGVGSSNTLYGTFARMTIDSDFNLTEASPTFKCNNSNDRFTKNGSTLSPIDGNGTNQKLRYPVGLITADETIFAGGYWASNSSYYLYTGQTYWTMSPSFFGGGFAYAFFVSLGGGLAPSNRGSVDRSFGVRVVISLKSDALKYGTGVIGDEFRISA